MFILLQAIKSKGYEKILLQIGNGSVIPQKCTISGVELDFFKFKPSIDEEIKNASLIVSHAGRIELYTVYCGMASCCMTSEPS